MAAHDHKSESDQRTLELLLRPDGKVVEEEALPRGGLP